MKTMLRVSTMIALGTSIFLSGVAFANESNSSAWDLFHGAPKVKDSNGNYWKLRGRVILDIADLSETAIGGTQNSRTEDEFRAARIGVEGQYDNFKYTAEVDFAGSKTTYTDIKLTWKGPVAITVGQMKAGGSMDEVTSGRHLAFMERGMATDGFGFDRRLGINVAKTGKNYGVNAGIFGNSINGAKDGKPSNTIVAARGYYAPVLEKGKVVHVGSSVRFTDNAVGAPKRSARWGLHLASEKVKPVIGAEALLLGFEAATIQGPFHSHAEFLTEDGGSGTANGGFVQAGYFLTGESRKYKGGKFDRTKPKNPLSTGGFGAWEIGARFDTFNAHEAGDEKVDAYTVGLTWYPESHLRVKLNYTGASGDKYEANGLQMRLQMDW